jgi:hypothetical protein
LLTAGKMSTWFRRLAFGLRKHQGLVVVILAALAVRLVWNLAIHPPLDFAISDMAGYLKRADDVFLWRTKPAPYMTLFPWGTHTFVFVLKCLFGKQNRTAIGIAFALVGMISVAYSYATAANLFPNARWIRKTLGLLLVVYYPWISLSGYVLSEPLFTATVAATTFYALRLADRGRARDAWYFGIAAALGTLFRPQMLLSVALFGLHAIIRKRAWKHRHFGNAIRVAIPIAVVLGISIARSEHELNRFALVSTNGPLNFAFGRCHATTIEAKAKDGSGFFGPPPLGALLSYEKKNPNALFKLKPAASETIKFRGHMWDGDKLTEIAEQCIETTGWAKQAYYAATHVVLLYGYNTIWPDAGLGSWRKKMAPWCHVQLPLVVPALVYAFLRTLSRRRPRELLVAMHLWALLITAILYFGDTRYRAPYDGVIFLLVLPVYLDIRRGTQTFFAALVARFRRTEMAAPAAASGTATLSKP